MGIERQVLHNVTAVVTQIIDFPESPAVVASPKCSGCADSTCGINNIWIAGINGQRVMNSVCVDAVLRYAPTIASISALIDSFVGAAYFDVGAGCVNDVRI